MAKKVTVAATKKPKKGKPDRAMLAIGIKPGAGPAGPVGRKRRRPRGGGY